MHQLKHVVDVLSDSPPGTAASHRIVAVWGVWVMGLVRYVPRLLDVSQLAEGALFAHQQQGVEWMLTPVPGHRRCVRVLAHGTGMGKSVQVIAAIDHMLSKVPDARVLLVVPANTIPQWISELDRFAPTVGVHRVTGDSYLSADMLARVFVCSHQVMHMQASGLANQHFDAVFVDELAQVGKASIASKFDPIRLVKKEQLKSLALVCQSAPFVVGMTATLAENNFAETYGFLDAVGVRGLPPWPMWRQWLEYNGGYTFWQVNRRQDVPPDVTGVTTNGVEKIRACLGLDLPLADPLQMVLFLTPEDVGLSMPSRTGEQLVAVELTHAQQQAYYEAARLENGLASHIAKQAASRLVEGESALVDAAIDRITGRLAGQKVIVYAENIAIVEMVEARLDAVRVRSVRVDGEAATGIKRTKAIEQHKDPQGPNVLIGTKTLERGLNLQHARVLISIDPTYNPAAEQQRVGRICRIGSPHKTYEHIVLLPDVEHAHHKIDRLVSKYEAAVKVGLAKENLDLAV